MYILWSAISLIGGACCIWLTVRVLNRQKYRIRWLLAAATALPVLYVASFAPVWGTFGPRRYIPGKHDDLELRACRIVYRPIFWAMKHYPWFHYTMDRYCDRWQSPVRE